MLSCEDGQEEHLEELANNLNIKFEEARSTLGNIGENRLIDKRISKVSEKDWIRLKKFHLEKNDIVFSRVGSVDRRVLIKYMGFDPRSEMIFKNEY